MTRKYCTSEPFFLQWDITDRCSLHCRHCYRSAPVREIAPRSYNVVLDQFEELLESLDRCGRIQLSGGEPFESPELFNIIRLAGKRSWPVRILSNGVNITPETVRLLQATHCRLVQVSLEGPELMHDAIRGSGSFKRALNGIRLLAAGGVEVTVSMTLSKQNAGALHETMKLAAREAQRFHFSRVVPIGAAEQNCQPLTAGETYRLFREAQRVQRRYPGLELPRRDPLWHEYAKAPVRSECQMAQGCSAGYNGIAVGADGTIFPCRRLPIPLGNILEENLAQLWQDAPTLRELRDRSLLKGRCGICARRWQCGGCRAVAYALRRDYLAEDPQCFRDCQRGFSLTWFWRSEARVT